MDHESHESQSRLILIQSILLWCGYLGFMIQSGVFEKKNKNKQNKNNNKKSILVSSTIHLWIFPKDEPSETLLSI